MSIVGESSGSTAGGTEYFNRNDVLKNWGFDGSHCHNCGISNSELSGLLMQCGKCKKAYYCGMKCFNADLPRHQSFCGTQTIASQPKGGGTEAVKLNDNKIVREISDVKVLIDSPPEKEKSPKKSDKKEKSKKGEKDKKKEKKEKKVKSKMKEEKDREKLEEETLRPENNPVETVPPEHDLVEDFAQECSACDFSSPCNACRDRRNNRMALAPKSSSEAEKVCLRSVEFLESSTFSPLELEHVDLHRTEIQKREIEKYTPDWALGPNLRQTEIGEKIKTVGDVREIKLLRNPSMEKDGVSYHVPDWAKTPILKKTELGEKLKNGIDAPRSIGTGSKSSLPYLYSSTSSNEKEGTAQSIPEWATTPLKKKGGDMLKQGVDVIRMTNSLTISPT